MKKKDFIIGLKGIAEKVNEQIGKKERDFYIKTCLEWKKNIEENENYDFRPDWLEYIEDDKHFKTGEMTIQCGFNIQGVYLLYRLAQKIEKMTDKEKIKYLSANKRWNLYKHFFKLNRIK